MPGRIAIGCLALGILAAAAPMARGADPIEIFQSTQRAQKVQQNLEIRQSTLLDDKHPSLPASAVYSVSVEQGMLIVRTPLPDSGQEAQSRVKIGDQSDWTFLSIDGGAANPSSPVLPDFFVLQRESIAANQIEWFNLQQMAAISFNISLRVQTPTGEQVVSFREQFPVPAAHFPGTCVLVVRQLTIGHPWQPNTWGSANFSAFMLEHPAEADRYLRPLLREAGADGLLKPDPRLAFELFHDQWSADSATVAAVKTLVDQLAGGDFHSRTAAQKKLAAMGTDAVLVLIHLDRSKLDPEQNDRVDRLIAPYFPLPKGDAAKLRTNPLFLADCLYSDDPEIRRSAFVQLLSVTRLPLKFDPDASPSIRMMQIKTLLAQIGVIETPSNQP